MKRDPSPVSVPDPTRYNGGHEPVGPMSVARTVANAVTKLTRAWPSGALAALMVCGALAAPVEVSAAVLWEADPVVFAKSDSISLEEATEIVRRAYGGRVLSASPATQNGKRGYKIRVLLDGGRVKTVFVDSNGAVRG